MRGRVFRTPPFVQLLAAQSYVHVRSMIRRINGLNREMVSTVIEISEIYPVMFLDDVPISEAIQAHVERVLKIVGADLEEYES